MSAGLTLPATGGGISDETAAFAAELIDRSGKAPAIEAALAHPTGRPRPLPVRAVLTALLCLALDDRPLFLTEATRLLFCQLSPVSRRLLKVTGTVTTQRAFLAACCARSLKMRMTASFMVRMCGREEGPAGGSRRGLGVRGGAVVVSLT